MRHKEGRIKEKISIKWKIFLYLLSFTAVLLVLLWIFQIGYLDAFYKMIKNREAESALSQAVEILKGTDSDMETALEKLASEYNLAILVADTEGETVYYAEYMANSRMRSIPCEALTRYYNQAKEQGGTAKIEFEGSPDVPMTVPEKPEQESSSNNIKRISPQEGGGFQQHRKKMIQSAIYVEIVQEENRDLIVMVDSQLTPIDATVDTLRIQFLWITAILLVLSLMIAFLLSKNISKSIIKVNQSARELAKGNYSVEFSGKDYREITELSETLNYAARELEKTEGLRKELIANVSHDLRTPLTMIIAYSEVMRDLPGENTPENIQVIIDESRRLTNLVNDMLDISKLQAGVMEKELSVYNLTESIQSVLQRYNKLKEQEGYSIEFWYEQEIMVEADEFKIYQVIYNLVNNAINYTGEDKRVAVWQKVNGNKVRIEISDTGEGIQPEYIPYVWDRYYKVDKTHKRAVMGTGLGLSIVKNILILHEAEYGVESEMGKGSIFWFELPLYMEEK